MMNVDCNYRIPTFLSSGSAMVIRQMLDNDVINRITIARLRTEPWFQINCPLYLSIPWEEYKKTHG